jgi:hypothetical protein
MGLALALAALGAATTFGPGCDPNSGIPILTPTGGDTGVDCTSLFTKIQMVGDFTTPSFSIPDSPELVEGEPCIWKVTVNLKAGPVLFKFVTDGAFDNPQDYGGSETVTLNVPGGPYATQLVSGTGTAIKIQVATAGDYTFTLNEKTLKWSAEPGAPPPAGGVRGTVEFTGLTSAPYPRASVILYRGTTRVAGTTSDPDTRRFEFTGVAPGSYRVVVTASTFTQAEKNVTVTSGVADVGVITLAEGTSAFSTIDLVGGFNFFTPGADPMTQVSAGVWVCERNMNAGVFLMKFLTDGQYDTPPDYGGDESLLVQIPGGGPVRPVSGPGTAIQIEVTQPGLYRFTLDERLQRWDAQLVTPARAGGSAR